MNPVRHRESPLDKFLSLVDAELSLAARLGQATLLLGFVVMIGVIGFMGVAQPSLPPQARIAFAAVIAIGAFGTAFAIWAMSSRRALLARQRVLACRATVALAALQVLAAAIIGFVKGNPAANGVAGFGVIILIGAAALLRQANQNVATLTARRETLGRQLKLVK